MAGIGFVLRNLTRQDNLIGLAAGYGYSALLTTGPWIFTILALGASLLFGKFFTTYEQQAIFRIIIIYNFSFSLVFSGPIILVVTRYLSDRIYIQDVKDVPGILVGAMSLAFVTQTLILLPFYLFYWEQPFAIKLMALANYLLITGIWLVSAFLSALKDYSTISRLFGLGMILGMALTGLLSVPLKEAGMLFGFNCGLALILYGLMARVFAEYPYRGARLFHFMSYFRDYWELACSGFVFNLAGWADKWIMWFSPHAERIAGGLPSYPDYDSAMFLAYLTIIPALAAFMVSMETEFFEYYLRFYRDIQRHSPFHVIEQNHLDLLKSVKKSGRNFLVIQGSITLTAILLAPTIIDILNINYLQISIFRLGILGAFYHVLLLFLLILISYIDFRKHALAVQTVFLLTNGLFTWGSMSLGFPYYGYGYFLSCLVTFAVALLVVFHLLGELPYQTFVTQNRSISG